MSNLPEDNSAWISGIYQLEVTDPVEGGPGGVDNLQSTQLGNRTAWLKARVLAALRMEDIEPVTGVHAITAADIGQVLSVHDPASASFTLPSLATFPKGNPLCIVVRDIGTADIVHLNTTGGDLIENFLNSGDGVTSYQLVQGSRIVFIAGITSWVVVLKTEPAPVPVVVAGFQAGDVKFTASPTTVAQAGFLLCAGQFVSRTTYADLFAAVGTIYGAGDGTTTFELPDYRDRFPRLHNGTQGLDPGRVFGTNQADSLKAHTHDSGLDITLSAYETASGGPDEQRAYIRGGSVTTGSTGGSETRPVNFSINGWIKY